MTWLFVNTSPLDVRTMPVPAAAPFAYARFVSTTTTPVWTDACDVRANAAWTPTASAASAKRRASERFISICCTHEC